MKFFLFMVAIAFSIVSCDHPSSKSSYKSNYKRKRIIALEHNTVSFVIIPNNLDSVYRDNDTVWVNMTTHRIDDLDSSTTRSVIKP